ncbi:MAG: FAD-binding oxidoreductase [Pseudomonadota bacterium]|nr:FAD-binding oxidoreductase [Pseudomonadota bacterium]
MKISIIKKIESIIGKKNLLLTEEEKRKYLIEWRERYPGKAKGILKPKNVKEISSLMKIFHKEKISIIPQGGNTGLVGGQISYSEEHFILSLERMNKLININVLDQSITIQSGMILSEIQRICDEKNMLFPLSLASEGSCTIGGNIATNAGGVSVLYYGNTRDFTLGLQIVLADGTIIDSLKTLKKDNTGYSIKDLFIGSEGTLGIITAASLKIFPKPKEKFTFFCSVKDPKKSIELLRFLQKNISTPLTAFEFMNNASIKLTLEGKDGSKLPIKKKSKWYILFEFSKIEESKGLVDLIQTQIADAQNHNLINEVIFANSLNQSNFLWKIRDNISEAQKKYGSSIKNDFSVPIFSIHKFIEEADKIVNKIMPGAKNITFGHVGDGNIHYNISQPKNLNSKQFLSLEKKLRSHLLILVKKYNGSFSAEHGVGLIRKKDAIKLKKDEIKLMQKIKKAVDPEKILNPGKIFD